MAFSVHTFETNPEGNLGFAYHQNIGEGQEVYFLAKFALGTTEAQNIAESLFGAIVDHLSKPSAKDHYDHFEEALKKANQAFRKDASQTSKTPEIVVALFDFHHLYLTQSGESEAYLIRDGGVSQITEIPEESDDLFLNILSGQVNIDDVVILSSNRILRTLTANELSDIFAKPSYRESTNSFKHELSQKSNEDLLVTIIGIGKKEGGMPAAGFLSKVMTNSPAEKVVSAAKEVVKPSSETEPIPEEPSAEHEEIPEVKITKSKTQFIKPETVSAIKNFRPQKNLLILASVVLTLFFVGLGIKSINWESEEEIRLREELDIAREAIQQADTYLVQGDKTEAKDSLERANSAVQEVFKSKSKLYRSDAQFLLADIKAKQLQVENARQVTPNLLADLGVKSDTIDATGLLNLDGSLFAYDSKQVIKSVRNIVEAPINVNESGGSILAAASRPDQKTLTFITDNPRVIEYKEGIITPMQTQDENWKKGIDVQTYGRYTYILDPAENQIWKYERRRSNYSASTAYNQGANLAESVSFAIDGAIYVVSASGEIQKIFRGVSQDYDFRDLPSTPITGPNVKLYTTAELDYIYVLDPDNERLLVFVKGDRFATYKRQILYGIDDARDFIVDEGGQTVSLLTKNKIYEFNL